MQFEMEKLLSVLQVVLAEEKKYTLHEPLFKGNEWRYVKSCIDSGWVSSVGKFVDQFEHDLAEYCGSNYAIVTVNGTAAIHISFLLAGVKENDEVLVPSLTFIATCNAIRYCGAMPHFVDSERHSLGVDSLKLESYLNDIAIIKNKVCYNRLTQRPIRAICVMHTFGHPVDLDAIKIIADRYHLALVEDAAEAMGSLYKNKHVGNHGLLNAVSFNGNKIITTGGGGAILTNNKKLAITAKHFTTTAKKKHPWLFQHDEIAYNYRMPNLNAALGCAQLEQLDSFLATKRRLAMQYKNMFANIDGIDFIEEPAYANSNYWLNAVLLDQKFALERDQILQHLNNSNILARPVWDLMHQSSLFISSPKMDLSSCTDLASRLINLPSSVFIGEKIIEQEKSFT